MSICLMNTPQRYQLRACAAAGGLLTFSGELRQGAPESDRYKSRAKFDVIGTPGDLDAARDLALRSEHDGRYQFQYWAVSLVNANLAQNKNKGADGGVDGTSFSATWTTARTRSW